MDIAAAPVQPVSLSSVLASECADPGMTIERPRPTSNAAVFFAESRLLDSHITPYQLLAP